MKSSLGISTGYLDRNGNMIRAGHVLFTGMRRGDPKGWTKEVVVWSSWNKAWLLEDLNTGEKGQFQYDQQLREIIGEKIQHAYKGKK